LKILYIHNNYASDNTGEEHAAEALVNLLRENGHTVEWYRRSSSELAGSPLKQVLSIFTGIWNPVAIRDVKKGIQKFCPDVVQVQNVYPLISPRVIKTVKNAGLPVVMRCPNYRLFCPTGLFYDPSGNVCEKCTGPGRELWCIRKNCMGSRGKSIAYALRNCVARITDVFRKYVDVFIVQSEFQRRKFIDLGIDANKICVLPGITPDLSENENSTDGKYVSFVGRVSREKGIDDFIAAASKMPEVQFAIAGNIPEGVSFKNAPGNIEWKGFLNGKDLDDFYHKSAVIVVPSKWYEGFPNVITRAMYHSKPVITTNIGCFPDIIDHGVNGLMYPSGDIDGLVEQIYRILSNPSEAEQMGKNGKEKAEKEYSREVIFKKLMEVYHKAISSASRLPDVPNIMSLS